MKKKTKKQPNTIKFHYHSTAQEISEHEVKRKLKTGEV